MKADVSVRQLYTDKTYINILRGGISCGIGVWGNNYKNPTHLLLRGSSWLLVTFDDEASRDDELPNLIRTWAAEKVIDLTELGKEKT